jgi:hypothetical protein
LDLVGELLVGNTVAAMVTSEAVESRYGKDQGLLLGGTLVGEGTGASGIGEKRKRVVHRTLS